MVPTDLPTRRALAHRRSPEIGIWRSRGKTEGRSDDFARSRPVFASGVRCVSKKKSSFFLLVSCFLLLVSFLSRWSLFFPLVSPVYVGRCDPHDNDDTEPRQPAAKTDERNQRAITDLYVLPPRHSGLKTRPMAQNALCRMRIPSAKSIHPRRPQLSRTGVDAHFDHFAR